MSTTDTTSMIGTRLRRLRLASGRSLSSVAESVGISPSALSQIETGAMQPSVNRLIEIVTEVGAPVSAVFDDHDVFAPRTLAAGTSEPIPGVHVSSAEGGAEGGAQGAPAATLGQGVVYRRLVPVALDGIDLFESVYPPGAASSIDGAMLVHAGYEMGSVIRGTLRFEFSEGTVELGPGGSLAFWATRPHRVVNASDDVPAAAIWLTLRDLSET